jgi:uncharacterized membrane protein YeaQ/YmgE (transglycosylase-associated protein family)
MEWLVTFMWTVIIALFVGVVIGGLARLLLPGKQKISLIATITIGFLAAVIGGLVAEAFGVADTDGIDWIKLAIQISLAIVGVGFYSGWFFRR